MPYELLDEAPKSRYEMLPPESGGINDRGGLLQNMAGGILRGAGSIGATLLAPIDAVARAAGVQNDYIGRTDRREAMDAALKTAGVDTNSMSFQGGKLGTEIAGTLGAGGGVANLLTKAAPKLAAAAPSVVEAIRTGGMSANGAGMVPRVIGGAINGGVTAGLVNPEDAATGAGIGGALPPAVKVAAAFGSAAKNGIASVAKNTLGMTTGAGADTFSTAYRAGKDGSTTFLDNMRGNVPMTDVLDSAKQALTNMRLARGAEYRTGMAGVAADKTVIDFAPIDKAINSISSMGSYKGQVLNKNAAGTVDEITGLVNQWKSLNPAEFHTPEGLDALKQAIGDIRDATQFGTPGRKAADSAYNAVKNEVAAQAPTYSKVMKDYTTASETLKEVERALSLGDKAAADTSMRKLQSLMRNNVNTNYGNRLGLAKTLEQNGADILPAVAGQAASSWTPRGLQGMVATGAGVTSLLHPPTLAALPFTSPRLMGEAAYKLGAINRTAGGLLGKVASPQALGNSSGGLLNFDAFAPLMATAPVLALSHR